MVCEDGCGLLRWVWFVKMGVVFKYGNDLLFQGRDNS